MKILEYIGNQGDVPVAKIDEFPSGERFIDDQCERGILAFGELSGHVHEIEDLSSIEMFRILNKTYEGLLFIDVKKPVHLRHGKQKDFNGKEADQDYHNKGYLPAGKYVSGIFTETDHLTGTLRRVVD